MDRLFLILAFITITIPGFSQTPTLDESKMVGFDCFYEARETKLVSRFGKMLKRKKYPAIARELYSDNPGAKLMAVLCLERLQAIHKRPISEEEKIQINRIRTSTQLVSVCSGCVPLPGIPMDQAFNTEILGRSKFWLEHFAKE